MDLAQFTSTIASFEPNSDRFENTRTGRMMTGGVLTFATCGHSYQWYPWGLADDEPMPATGATALCATCIQNYIDANVAK